MPSKIIPSPMTSPLRVTLVALTMEGLDEVLESELAEVEDIVGLVEILKNLVGLVKCDK